MPNVDHLQRDVRVVLDSLRSMVETASDLTWSPSDGFLPIVYRSIFRRQFESLDVISHLVASEKGYAAPPLLRPCCEELIWVKYLTSIAKSDAEQLVQCVTAVEMFDSLKAQDDFAGRSVTKDLGLLPALKRAEHGNGTIRSKLKTLGEKLNWECRVTRNSRLPSTKWLAKTTKQTDVYNFIYHATSRFVHFSGAELLRRVWGRPGSVSVRSIHFRDYWGAFALYWGLRLFLDSTIELYNQLGMPEDEVDGAQLLAAAQRIGEHGQVPIITAEELEWPGR